MRTQNREKSFVGFRFFFEISHYLLGSHPRAGYVPTEEQGLMQACTRIYPLGSHPY